MRKISVRVRRFKKTVNDVGELSQKIKSCMNEVHWLATVALKVDVSFYEGKFQNWNVENCLENFQAFFRILAYFPKKSFHTFYFTSKNLFHHFFFLKFKTLELMFESQAIPLRCKLISLFFIASNKIFFIVYSLQMLPLRCCLWISIWYSMPPSHFHERESKNQFVQSNLHQSVLLSRKWISMVTLWWCYQIWNFGKRFQTRVDSIFFNFNTFLDIS
jgi:hypothetical protein